MKNRLYWIISALMLPLYGYGNDNAAKTAPMVSNNNYSFNAHKQIKPRYQPKNRLKSKRPKNSIKKAYYTNKSFKV